MTTDTDDGKAPPFTTLRDMFAMLAPEVPTWFQPADSQRTRPLSKRDALHDQPVYRDLTGPEKLQVVDWLDGTRLDLRDDLLACAQAARAAMEESAAATRREYATEETARLIAWRWHYADAMIAARTGA